MIRPLLDAFRATGQRVVLPRFSEYEMMRSETDAATTGLKTMQLMTGLPEAFALARPSLVLRMHERRSQQPLPETVVIDRENTALFVNLIHTVRQRGESMRDELEAIAAASRRNFEPVLEHMASATTIRQIAGVAANAMGKRERAEIGQALEQGDRGPFRRSLVDGVRAVGLVSFLEGVGHRPQCARLLARFPSIACLTFVAYVALAGRWHVTGGLASFPDHKLITEDVDLEHAILACYGRELYTADGNARALYEDVLVTVPELWPEV